MFAIPLAFKLSEKLTGKHKSKSSNKNAPSSGSSSSGSSGGGPPKKPKHFYDVGGWLKYILEYLGYGVEQSFYAVEDILLRALDIFEGASWLLVGALFYVLFTDNPIKRSAISGVGTAAQAAPLLLL